MDSLEPIAPAEPDVSRDSWHALSRYTPARIALGRTGGSVRTQTQLDFRLAHARARDAVQAPFDADALALALHSHGHQVARLNTAALDRATYLRRPDLGRRLDTVSNTQLRQSASIWGQRDLALLVSDGLSAQATERNALATILPLVDHLGAARWTVYPIFIIPFARVKLQDEVGELLGARQTLMLLGERPGLGATDSLGAYFTYQPRATCTDADRNCLSNIRAEGLPPAAAARALAQSLIESARQKLSGVKLALGREASPRFEI